MSVYGHYQCRRQRANDSCTRIHAKLLACCKRILLESFGNVDAVTDLGAGHGADAGRYPIRVRTLTVLDFSSNQLESYKERLAKRPGIRATFTVFDFTTVPTFPVTPTPCVQVGLCAHYCWDTNDHAKQFMKNLSSFLTPGGVALLTLPDSGFILYMLRIHWVAAFAHVSLEQAETALTDSSGNCGAALMACGGVKPWQMEHLSARCFVPTEIVDEELYACDGDAEMAGERLAYVVTSHHMADFRPYLNVSGHLPHHPPVFRQHHGVMYNFSTGEEGDVCVEPLVPMTPFIKLANEYGLQCVSPLNKKIKTAGPMSVREYLYKNVHAHANILFETKTFPRNNKITDMDLRRVDWYCILVLEKSK